MRPPVFDTERTMIAPRVAALILNLALLMPIAATGETQGTRIEVRDPLRGVSFQTVQLSDVPLSVLDTVEGGFPDSGRLVVGLSALLSEGSATADEYILWLRHEGRQWLSLPSEQPVQLEVDGRNMELFALREPQAFVGPDSQFIEKLEYRLEASALERLADSRSILIRLRANDGVVEKRLSADEIELVRQFRLSTGTGATG